MIFHFQFYDLSGNLKRNKRWKGSQLLKAIIFRKLIKGALTRKTVCPISIWGKVYIFNMNRQRI
jgi:hypothetical protein